MFIFLVIWIFVSATFFFFENAILSPLNCFLILVLAKNQYVGLFLDTLLCNTVIMCIFSALAYSIYYCDF